MSINQRKRFITLQRKQEQGKRLSQKERHEYNRIIVSMTDKEQDTYLYN